MSKVLLVTTIYPPQIGGPATFINHFARFLSDKGHKVSVVCISEKKYPEMDKTEPFNIYRITPGFFRITFHLRKWIALIWFILTNDKILINGIYDESADICILFKKQYILKIVGDSAWEYARNNSLTTLNIDEFQTAEILSPQIQAIRKKMRKYVMNALFVYVPSMYLKTIVHGWGKEKDKIVVINNGVEMVEAKTLKPNTQNLTFKILFVGRITNWKGVEFLLAAVRDIKNIELNICGDGPALNFCIELNRRLGNSNVKFHGRVSHEVIKVHLENTDILVLPSLYEGLSHTILEAMAFGKPSLASAIGGNPEAIKHAHNGMLFNPYDLNELKDQILFLRDNPDFLIKLSAGCIDTINKFDSKQVYTQIEKLVC
ncbi:MAG: glycosyltransferase family 4 protein [Ferruginibacter sp.]